MLKNSNQKIIDLEANLDHEDQDQKNQSSSSSSSSSTSASASSMLSNRNHQEKELEKKLRDEKENFEALNSDVQLRICACLHDRTKRSTQQQTIHQALGITPSKLHEKQQEMFQQYLQTLSIKQQQKTSAGDIDAKKFAAYLKFYDEYHTQFKPDPNDPTNGTILDVTTGGGSLNLRYTLHEQNVGAGREQTYQHIEHILNMSITLKPETAQILGKTSMTVREIMYSGDRKSVV
jgi:hypothetical protein